MSSKRSTSKSGYHIFTMVVTLSIILVLAPNAMAGPDQISGRPTLTISPLDPQSQNVTVTETSVGTARYTGTVTVTKLPGFGTVTVYLEGESSVGYIVIVEPDQIVFKSPGDAVITVTVIVPQAAYPESSQVSVYGIATWVGGSTSAESNALLEVVQYFKMDVKAKTVSEGNPTEYTIQIQNTGNGPDKFDLEIVSRASLENNGFTFELDKMTEKVAPGENASVKLKVSYSMSSPSGDLAFKVRITSQRSAEGDNETLSKTVNLIVHVEILEKTGSVPLTIAIIVIPIVVIVLVVLFIIRRRKGPTKGKVGKKDRSKPKDKVKGSKDVKKGSDKEKGPKEDGPDEKGSDKKASEGKGADKKAQKKADDKDKEKAPKKKE